MYLDEEFRSADARLVVTNLRELDLALMFLVHYTDLLLYLHRLVLHQEGLHTIRGDQYSNRQINHPIIKVEWSNHNEYKSKKMYS